MVKKITLSVLAGSVLMSSGAVWAATVTSPPGTSSDWEIATGSTYHAKGNEVMLNNGADYHFAGGYSKDGVVSESKVTLSLNGGSGDYFGLLIYGGYSEDTATVKGNVLTIDGDIGTAHKLYGAYTEKGQAIENIVNIKGVVNAMFINAGQSREGAVDGNIINIYSSEAGKNDSSMQLVAGFGTPGMIKNNKIRILGNANLSKADLYGGVTMLEVPVFCFDGGNTLEIKTTSDKWDGKVKGVSGFSDVVFDEVVWGKTPLTIKEFYVGYDKAFQEEMKKNGIDIFNGETKIAVNKLSGDIPDEGTMTLIKAEGDIKKITIEEDSDGDPVLAYKAATIQKQTVQINSGIANVYNGTIEQEGKNKINLTLNSHFDNSRISPGGQGTTATDRNDQVLVLGESRAAATAFTNQGSELIETSLDALARDNEKDTKVFAAVYGNASEYETGSHVNVNGWSGIVGIGKTNANGLTVGAFFENGTGNYSTHNIYTDDYIRGDGEATYNGGGLLIRKDNTNGVYTEASLRAGNLQNELKNAVRNGHDLTGYDIDTFYYGAHVGVGKIIPRGTDGDSIDVYGKFIYTHHDGESFDIDGTETYFDSVESERLRLGFRMNEVQTNKLSMYYGAAWEYEFNGDAHDKVAGFSLETPSLKGSTVIGEVGMHYKASAKWSFDLNGRAYGGQRDGFSGSIQANYMF